MLEVSDRLNDPTLEIFLYQKKNSVEKILSWSAGFKN
jgi:hypothetical protein